MKVLAASYRRYIFLLPMFVLFASTARGQDESYSLVPTVTAIGTDAISVKIKALVDPTAPVLSAVNAGALLTEILGSSPAVDTDTAYVIHTVLWNGDNTAADQQHWYVYQASVPGFSTMSVQERLEDPRIYGRHHIFVVVVHYFNKGVATLPNVELQYSVSVTKQKSQLLSDLTGMVAIALAPKAPPLPPGTVAGYYGYKDVAITSIPSSITIAAQLGTTSAKSIGSKTITNESKYYADFSFAFPINSYTDINYSTIADGSLQPNKTDRQNIYAVADVYLSPVDISRPQLSPIPHVMLGIPLKTQPLRHLMIGMAIGVKWVEPFVGAVFDVQEVPGAAGSGTTVNHVAIKAIFGLNVPVATTKKILGGS